MNDDTVTVKVSDLDAMIERRMLEREAELAAAKIEAMKGKTPGCNCRAEGWLAKNVHQFGCPYAAKDVATQRRWLGGEE